MNRSEKEKNLLLQLLSEMAQGETVDYVVRGIQENLGADAPTVEAVREYLLRQDNTDSLDTQQQALVMDQLLEFAEVNFRTTCDLIRYRHFKSAGLVSSMEEFLALIYPDETSDWREEEST